jgi:hypothetical protein
MVLSIVNSMMFDGLGDSGEVITYDVSSFTHTLEVITLYYIRLHRAEFVQVHMIRTRSPLIKPLSLIINLDCSKPHVIDPHSI